MEKNPQAMSCTYSLKSSLDFCASNFFHPWYAPSLGVNQFSFTEAKFCFAGLLGPSLQMWGILLHLLKSTNHQQAQSLSSAGISGVSGMVQRTAMCKSTCLSTARFQMYTKSEKLPSLRHFIKEMCETEYTPHTNVWTTWKHCGHPPTLTTCEASFQRCARCLYVTPQSGTR